MKTTAMVLAALIGLSIAQETSLGSSAVTSLAAATNSFTILSAPAGATGEPCLQVSSLLASASRADPQATAGPLIQASLLDQCARSMPLVKADALSLVDGISAALQFQSDLGQLVNPPAQYPLAGIDLLGQLMQIRNGVSSGKITKEIDLEQQLYLALAKAHDGHLAFNFDGINTFAYGSRFSGLLSISEDGKALPELYTYSDFAILAESGGRGRLNAITQIDGQNASTYIALQGQNVTYDGYQDPDALYNNQLWQLNSGNGKSSPGALTYTPFFVSDNTTYTYENGSTFTTPTIGIWLGGDFSTLKDGPSLYNICCNATLKAEALDNSGGDSARAIEHWRADLYNSAHSHSNMRKERPNVEMLKNAQDNFGVQLVKREPASSTVNPITRTSASATATASGPGSVTRLPGYPTPIAIASDGSLSGYFPTEPGFTDVAVLVITAFSETAITSSRDTMTKFMNLCRAQNKKQLVIDVSGNPGGTISLATEIFKQLYPNLDPYGAATLRAQQGVNILGQYYTNISSQVLAAKPFNESLFEDVDGYERWSAESYLNASGQPFTSWAQAYGPVKTKADNYTNLQRIDWANPAYDIATGETVVSGYGNASNVPASPFTHENTVILSDGRCSSSCTILNHYLKWQAKVHSFAIGGRPMNAPMQAVGGVKGSQVTQYLRLAGDVYQAYSDAQQLGHKSTVRAIDANPILSNINNSSDYIVLRGVHAGTKKSANDFTLNLLNNVAEGDTSYTPLQFVYEAADCRLWYQAQHIYDVSNLWLTTAGQAFGLNGTQKYSLCVQGSTNSSSSLSGNSTVYNNGNPTNVTTFPAAVNGSSSNNGGDSGSQNTGGKIVVSGLLSMVALVSNWVLL